MIKKILKILSISIILVIGLLYVFTYIWFNNSIDYTLTQKQQDWLISEMSKTSELPDKIYDTMTKYFPNFFSTNSWNHKIKRILGFESYCQCSEIYLPFIPPGRPKDFGKKWIPFHQDDLLVKLFIEKNFNQKTCFTFNMNISEFGMNTNGIRDAAMIYFDKKLEDLTDREIIGLYFIQKAPTYYNPLFNRENFDRTVNEVMKNESPIE